MNYYKDEEIKLAVDDVAEKLGIHPEQMDVIFDFNQEYGMDIELELW